MSEEKSLSEKYIQKLKNNKLFAILIVATIIYFGISEIISKTNENIKILKENNLLANKDSIVKNMDLPIIDSSVTMRDVVEIKKRDVYDKKNNHVQKIKLKNLIDGDTISSRSAKKYPLSVLSNANGYIFIDNQLIGTTNSDIELVEGEHLIEIKFEYVTKIERVLIPKQKIITINI